MKNFKELREGKEFKPHMMYDPKTGKGYKAEKPEDHVRMKKMGYTHEKPEKADEALVASDMNILRAIFSKLEDDISKDKLAGRFEKSWPKVQALAKLAGYGITKKSQGKDKSYIWKLKK